MTAKPLPFESAVATGRGDDGTTGLLFGGPRVRKDDLRVEAYGTVDEAVAALGLARAQLGLKRQYGVLSPAFGGLGPLILRLQRELFVVAAELATTPDGRAKARDGETRVTPAMVEDLGTILRELEAAAPVPTEFVVPGQTLVSAALELARTTLRRAERRTVTLIAEGGLPDDSQVLPYLNRLADLTWVLARTAEAAESRSPAPRASRPRRPAPTPDAASAAPSPTAHERSVT